MLEKYEIVRAIFHGHDYSKGIHGTGERAADRIGRRHRMGAGLAESPGEKAVTDESNEARPPRLPGCSSGAIEGVCIGVCQRRGAGIRDEVGFFQAVRAALVKTTAKGKLSEQARMFVVEQLIDQAIANAEIVDILAAAGIGRPDLSVLSDEFLLEVTKMERKNLAFEALRKLLNGEIRSRTRTNVVETRKFSERLEAAVARYHANALSTVEVIQELIKLAQGYARRRRARRGRGADP